MLSVSGRGPAAVVVEPIARALNRVGMSPNTVTILATCLSSGLALWLIPTGHHVAAALLIGLSAAFDMIDGTMARLRGGGTAFGAVLDATCDRIADGAIFGSILVWLVLQEPISLPLVVCTLVVLVASQVTSYVKARAEASGMKLVGGLVERPERLIISLLAVGLFGLGVPLSLEIGLGLLALGSVATVIQRLWMAAQSDVAEAHIAAPAGAKEFHK